MQSETVTVNPTTKAPLNPSGYSLIRHLTQAELATTAPSHDKEIAVTDNQEIHHATGLNVGDWTSPMSIFLDGIPLNILGDDDDVAVDINTGIIYKKVSGVWTEKAAPSSADVLFVTALPSDATGSNGDLAVIYTGGVISGLAEKSGGTWSQIASNAVTSPKPTDKNVLSWVEHCLGGKNQTVAGSLIGTNNLYMRNAVGTNGYTRPDTSNANTAPTLGVCEVGSGNSSGDCIVVEMDNGVSSSNVFYVGRITRLNNFSLYFEFKVDTNGDFHFGLSNNSSTASAPTRFIGIKAVSGTTNFQFEATNGTPTTVDSGVPVDSGWHNFELTHNGTDWGMSIDGGAVSVVSQTVSDGLSVTLAAWVKSNSAGAQKAYIDTIKLYGEAP